MRCGDLRGVEPAAVTWGAMAIACGFARNSTQFFLARLGVGSERLAACRRRRHGFRSLQGWRRQWPPSSRRVFTFL